MDKDHDVLAAEADLPDTILDPSFAELPTSGAISGCNTQVLQLH